VAESEIEDTRCRLLVRLPATVERSLHEALAALAAADRLAGIVRSAAGADLARDLKTAWLLEDAGEPATGADGVVARVADASEVTALRRRWGRDGIIVAAIGASRHAAMEAGELGADAVLFAGPDEDLVDCLIWWQGLFVLPAAVPADAATLDDMVAAGADLLLVDGGWVTAALVERLAEAEAARPAPRPLMQSEGDHED
jgi:thiamine-phosphate pyrophosphorylase